MKKSGAATEDLERRQEAPLATPTDLGKGSDEGHLPAP